MKSKKLVLSVGTIAAVAAPIVSAVSCGADLGKNYVREGGAIYLITDTGAIKDSSFNEFVFNGIKDFANPQNKTYSYIQPQVAENEIFQKTYRNAIDKGAQAIVLPGFHHSADGLFSEVAAESPRTAFIGIDTWGHNTGANKNVLNLSYKTEQGGFLSAIYTGIYMNQNNKVHGDKLKVSAFGGVGLDSVTAYMDGWMQGVRFFNDWVRKAKGTYATEVTGASINNEIVANYHDPTDKAKYENFKLMEYNFVSGNTPSPKDYSGDFNPGTATDISKSLIEKGVQVVISVAGPQTADFIGASLELGKDDVYAIGVDTDQSLTYDSSRVLGSALKGIDSSTTKALNDLYSGANQRSGIPFNGGIVDFKSSWETFDHTTKLNGKPIVDFTPSIAIPKDASDLVTNTSLYIESLNYVDADKDATAPGVQSPVYNGNSITDATGTETAAGQQLKGHPELLPIGITLGYGGNYG